MQRLRSPFRLRPGPGSEHRKGKGRRGHEGMTGEGAGDAHTARSIGDPDVNEGGAPEMRGRQKSASTASGPAAEGERAGDPQSTEPKGPAGSE